MTNKAEADSCGMTNKAEADCPFEMTRVVVVGDAGLSAAALRLRSGPSVEMKRVVAIPNADSLRE
jgi:hypothetical protein